MPTSDRMTLPELSFLVRVPTREKLYLAVCIAPTLQTMRRVMRESLGECHPRQWAGLATLHPNKRDSAPLIGVLFLPLSRMGGGLVAHELAHLSFRLVERQGERVRHWQWTRGRAFADKGGAHTTEERFCDLLQELTARFWHGFYPWEGRYLKRKQAQKA